VLKGKGVLPTHKASQSKVVKGHLTGFVVSSKGSFQEEVDLSKVRTNDGVDPNVYKLLKKFSFDFNRPVPLRCVIESKPYGINETQKKI